MLHLRCEYAENPLGIDVLQPRLSWGGPAADPGQRQVAYQLLVAGSEAALAADQGDLWDSGKVVSEVSTQVPYAGVALHSGQRCWWKVRVWDDAGKVSAYSASAWWEMGLLAPEEWHGQWIAHTTDIDHRPAPLLRRDFTLEGEIVRARAYLCGLGYHELYLNGQRIGDALLEPGYTRFDRRALYVTHDITPYLQAGENAVGLMLGHGWYNVQTRAVWYFEKAPWRAAPKALVEIRVEFADGRTQTIVSDAQWQTADGPIRFASIYGGETYDARLEQPGWDQPGFIAAGWQPAVVVAPPGGVLSAEMLPPITVTQTLAPVAVREPHPGVYLFDMGQNCAGRARLTLSAPAGTTVVMQYGERLHPDGTLDPTHIAQFVHQCDPSQQFQTDTYVCKGAGVETWASRFVYHGFQYVQVTGLPSAPTAETLLGLAQHTAVAPAGSFACSNDLLNRIAENTRWSYLSNLQSIPTDCPHREKNGWTGDAQIAAEQALYNFDSARFYVKWLNDLKDEQRDTGELPGIVPTSGWGYHWGNGPAWDSAYLLIPWYLYCYCADTRILGEHYAGMKRYVDYLTSKAEDGIVSIGLGDWCPFATSTPENITSTGYYYRDAGIVAQAAALLGKEEDARRYAALAREIKQAFTAHFFDPATGQYGTGSQTALSCALFQELVEPEQVARVVDNLVQAVAAREYHLDTGILGAQYVMNSLLRYGRADVAYRIAAQETLPSWGYWVRQGATTLWEAWIGDSSRNHIMFGDIGAWLYKALPGLLVDPAAPGFRHVIIRPQVVGDLTWARATYRTLRGEIASAWTVEDGTLTLRVTLPYNTAATVYLPTTGPVTAPGARLLRTEAACAIYAIEAGEYVFTTETQRHREEVTG